LYETVLYAEYYKHATTSDFEVMQDNR